MDVSLDDKSEGIVRSVVDGGRFASANEVVREGLRLVEEREAKLRALREMVEASLASGPSLDDADVEAIVRARLDQWKAKRKPT